MGPKNLLLPNLASVLSILFLTDMQIFGSREADLAEQDGFLHLFGTYCTF